MRSITALTTLFALSQAQLLPLLFDNLDHAIPVTNHRQQPMADTDAPAIQLPNSPSSSGDTSSGDVILSDIIGSQRPIGIFASFTRDISSVSSRLDTTTLNTTVLAPLNTAIQALPRKPWENPSDYEALGVNAYEGQQGEDRAHANLRRFTEAHVVPENPWEAGHKVQALGGNEVWWERRDGKTFVMPGEVEVDKVVSKIKNGEVWVLKGVLNYAS